MEAPVDPPDQMIVENGGWQLRSSLTRNGDIFTPNERAGHAMEGIFVFHHPWAKAGRSPNPWA